MKDLAPFPDVEEAILDLLSGLGNAGQYLPDNLLNSMPFHLVYRFAGADDGISDYPVIGIDTFAGTRELGSTRAELVRQRMIAAPHAVTTGEGVVVIDKVLTSQAPREIPYGDASIRRWESSYAVTLRRRT